ncbi:MAG: hypothetical protein R3F14_44765 [Polyangiaceae bacterium]
MMFNHYNGNGTPIFGPNSGTTPVPVGPGSVDSDGIVPDYESSYQRQIDMFPLADSVRRWVAPYDGIINITGNVALIESTDPDRAQYTTADGVTVAIQQNGSELWYAEIGATDYASYAPSGVTGIPVLAGDRIYFVSSPTSTARTTTSPGIRDHLRRRAGSDRRERSQPLQLQGVGRLRPRGTAAQRCAGAAQRHSAPRREPGEDRHHHRRRDPARAPQRPARAPADAGRGRGRDDHPGE